MKKKRTQVRTGRGNIIYGKAREEDKKEGKKEKKGIERGCMCIKSPLHGAFSVTSRVTEIKQPVEQTPTTEQN